MREESKEVPSRGMRREEEQDIRKAKSEHSHLVARLTTKNLKSASFGKLADFTQVRTA